MQVTRYKNESINSLYNRFKKMCKDDKLMLRIKEKEYFIKPSLKKRLKRRHNKQENL